MQLTKAFRVLLQSFESVFTKPSFATFGLLLTGRVDPCIVIRHPRWAPTKVLALPVCMRLDRNRQGLSKGRSKKTAKKNSAVRKQASKKSQQAAAVKKKTAAIRTAAANKNKTPH